MTTIHVSRSTINENGRGCLYIVATPIGNLADITFRAIDTLKTVDAIACEDTRRTRVLLNHYAITKPLISFYSYNQGRRTGQVIARLQNGERIALVSDAGTPGISDPGHMLIKEAIDLDIPVASIPGPTALISALVTSGKPTGKFIYEGFLSNKSSQRRKRLTALAGDDRTVILYESPHRIVKCLNDIADCMENPHIVCLRELTKKFEEVSRGPAREIAEYFTRTRPKGEFVVII